MDAVLLVLECVAFVIAMRWVAAGRGDGGALGWREPSAARPKPRPLRGRRVR